MNNIVNQMPYLRTSRSFPTIINELVVELNKAYVDTANVVNQRTIGLFSINRPALTGESWFFDRNEKQQTFRQVYTFTTLAAINHGIIVNTPGQFTRCFGSYTDGANNYNLPWSTNIAIAGQITFYVTPTQIIFLNGGAPALASGRLVLEWLSVM